MPTPRIAPRCRQESVESGLALSPVVSLVSRVKLCIQKPGLMQESWNFRHHLQSHGFVMGVTGPQAHLPVFFSTESNR